MPPKSSSKSAKIKPSASNIKTIGYLRVSTGDQELEKNKSDILHLANHLNLGRVNFVEEIVSGKVSWKKRKIAEIIEEFKKGDTLIVSELSRLGRSMLECMEILSVAVEKGVQGLCGQRQLVARQFDSKQNRGDGFFDGIGNRTRSDLATN